MGHLLLSAESPQLDSANKGTTQRAYCSADSSNDGFPSNRRLWRCAEDETKKRPDET